jgi:hypothetical protein
LELTVEYVTGTTPASIIFTADYANAVASGDITFDTDRALFGASKAPSCSAALSTGTVAFTCASNGLGTKLTATISSGSIPAGATLTLTLTDSAAGDIIALSGTGAVTITDAEANTAADTLTGDPIAFYPIQSPSISLHTDNLLAGTTWNQLDVSVYSPFAVPGGSTIQLTASKQIFVASQTSGVSVLSANLGTVTVSTSSASLLTITTDAGVNLAANQQVTLRIQSPLAAALPTSAGVVDLTFRMKTIIIASAVAGFGSIIHTTASDPITFVNGTKTKFWLPPRVLSPLFIAPDVKLLASPLLGPHDDLQWFERFVVLRPNGDEIAQISIRRQQQLMLGSNRSSFRRGRFNQLEIQLFGNTRPEERLRQTLISRDGGTIKVGLGSQSLDRPRTHSGEKAEYIYIETPTCSFVVFASHAGNEFPKDLHLQTKYTHLDWICLTMDEGSSFTGILPELWGIAPMSEQVSSMLTPPSQANASMAHEACNSNACENDGQFVIRN